LLGCLLQTLRSFPSFKYVNYIAHFPKPLGHASGHRWRRAQRLMDANEIVIQREQRDGMCVVLDLL
jgi:hypothetical protein